jgi:hypothetical protein
VDMGAVAILAWAGTLWYQELGERGLTWRNFLRSTIVHGLGISMSVALAFGLYAVFAFLRSGRWINLEDVIRYQTVFYRHGFMMLPMKIIELWVPLITLYVVVIFSCMRHLWRGNVTPRVSLRFCVSLLGCGVFTYFQGRSHIKVLVGVVYPAVILSGLLLYDAMDFLHRWTEEKWWRTSKGRLVAMQALLLSIPIAGGLHLCLLFQRNSSESAPDRSRVSSSDIRIALEPIRNLLAGEPTIIFSRYDGWLHMALGTHSPLPTGSMTEMLLLSQVELADEQIRQGRDRYILVTPWSSNLPDAAVEYSLKAGGHKPSYAWTMSGEVFLVLYTNQITRSEMSP